MAGQFEIFYLICLKMKVCLYITIFDKWSVPIFEFKIRMYEHLISEISIHYFKMAGFRVMGFLWVNSVLIWSRLYNLGSKKKNPIFLHIILINLDEISQNRLKLDYYFLLYHLYLLNKFYFLLYHLYLLRQIWGKLWWKMRLPWKLESP